MKKAKTLSKRTHEQRIAMLENTVLNLHDNVLPALQNAIAERDSVNHALVLHLQKIDPTRKMRKVTSEQGSFYLFASDEELAELEKEAAAPVDTGEVVADTSKG